MKDPVAAGLLTLARNMEKAAEEAARRANHPITPWDAKEWAVQVRLYVAIMEYANDNC